MFKVRLFRIWFSHASLRALSQSQPIDHALFSKLGEADDVPSKRALEDVTTNFGTVVHPPGAKAARIDQTLSVKFYAMPRGMVCRSMIFQHVTTQFYRESASDG
ncbi:hypothetical protein V8352_18880 [Roseovarius sp. D0-M9]